MNTLPTRRSLPAILSAVALLLLTTTGPCFALMELANISKEQAKEMGMIVRSNAAGPHDVYFELTFEPKGILKDFQRASLEITANGKMLVSATLQADRTKPGRITVSFAAAHDQLPQITLRLIAGTPMNYTGHDLPLKDFVDLASLR